MAEWLLKIGILASRLMKSNRYEGPLPKGAGLWNGEGLVQDHRGNHQQKKTDI